MLLKIQTGKDLCIMKLGNIDIQIGGFHDHWLRNGSDVSSILIAAVTKYHYDFICLLDAEFGDKAIEIKNQLEKWMPGFKAYIGSEKMYGWGHMITVMNDCPNVDLQNEDFKDEMKKLKEYGGIVALAHINHELSREKIVKAGYIDELIDGGYVDAIQIQGAEDINDIQNRIDGEKKLPLVSGWDVHYITPVYGMPNCIYDKNFDAKKHLDNAKLVRTIVFAENNSLSSIKKALNEGKSVVEDILTGNLYGSQHLIDLLNKNGYRKKIKELDEEYNKIDIKSDILQAESTAKIKFSQKGIVTFAKNKELDTDSVYTDAEGCILYNNIPMPVKQDGSYLPIMLDTGNFRRYWAIRVENNIILTPQIDLKNGKRVLKILTEKDFQGKIVFENPYYKEFIVSKNKGEIVCELEIKDDVPQIFDYKFTAFDKNGNFRIYESKAVLTVIHRYNGNWDNAEMICVDDKKFCGGFGSFREYPGKDVYSYKFGLLWDDTYLYAKFDITDKLHIAPPHGEKMYLSDCNMLIFEALLTGEQTNIFNSGFTIGFPEGTGEIYCGQQSVIYDRGETYYGERKGFSPEDAHVELKETKNGRIVFAKIPWNRITSSAVGEDFKINLAVCGLNDEGTGLVDDLQWPWPPEEHKMNRDKNAISTMILKE